MTNESIREHCLGLPHVTEIVQWEEHLLFKVGGKMFAIIDLDGHGCSLKCDPEQYAELVEMADIVPCSHNMWKYHWVTTETLTAVPDREFRALLTASYEIVRAGLSKKIRAELDAGRSPVIAPWTSKKKGRSK
jgi:predicted DNA-binding protein (MmcQ/YjbR family)